MYNEQVRFKIRDSLQALSSETEKGLVLKALWLDLYKKNMLRTILILLFSIIVVPLVSIYFGEPLSEEQSTILQNAAFIALAIALGCFLLSEICKNYSQVDKIWSIAPIIYSWFIVASTGWNDRMVMMAVLVTVWGVRLTLNFARRGGYSWRFWEGEEDYRWAILRENKIFRNKGWNWRLFNLIFISLYQNMLIFLFTIPIIAAMAGMEKPLGVFDFLLAIAFLIFLIIETVADQQQWAFQTKKYELINAGKPLDEPFSKGFTDSGLWGWMRHPNYFAEQSIWIIFYLFSVVATGDWINWSMIGCLLLMILFYNSSNFSEEISAAKYPLYKDYQKRVGRFLPKFF